MTATERKLAHDLIEMREENMQVKKAFEALQAEVRAELQVQHQDIKKEVKIAFDELSGFFNASKAAGSAADGTAQPQKAHKEISAKMGTIEERISDNTAQVAKLKVLLGQQEERIQSWVNAMREAIELRISDIYSKVTTTRQAMLHEVRHLAVISALDVNGLDSVNEQAQQPTLRENGQAVNSKDEREYRQRLDTELAKVKAEMRAAGQQVPALALTDQNTSV